MSKSAARQFACAAAGLALGLALPSILRRLSKKEAPKKGGTHAVRSGLANSLRVPRAVLVELAAACLEKAGATAAHARMSAETLVYADMRGIPSHGVNRADVYAAELEAKLIDGGATPTVERKEGCCALVDGHNGLGAVVSHVALDLAVSLAKEHGVGWVVCKRTNHFGAAGFWAARARVHGLMGFSFTNTAPFVVPTGGHTRAVGTSAKAGLDPTTGFPSLLFCSAHNQDAAGSTALRRPDLLLRSRGRRGRVGARHGDQHRACRQGGGDGADRRAAPRGLGRGPRGPADRQRRGGASPRRALPARRLRGVRRLQGLCVTTCHGLAARALSCCCY